MAIASKDINFDYASADFYARIICVETAGKICASNPEYDAVAIAEQLYQFVMEGANDQFKRIVVATKSCNH